MGSRDAFRLHLTSGALRNVALFALIFSFLFKKERLVFFWEFKAAGLWQLGVV